MLKCPVGLRDLNFDLSQECLSSRASDLDFKGGSVVEFLTRD